MHAAYEDIALCNGMQNVIIAIIYRKAIYIVLIRLVSADFCSKSTVNFGITELSPECIAYVIREIFHSRMFQRTYTVDRLYRIHQYT